MSNLENIKIKQPSWLRITQSRGKN